MMAERLRMAARVAPLIVCALLAIEAVRIGVSGMMLRDHPERALSVWSGSSAAASQVAENLARSGKLDEAQALAVRTLSISVQDSQALHTLADIGRSRGNLAITDTALTIAAHLGWRDVFVQGWVLDRAMQQKDVAAMAQSADALLRLGFDPKRPFAALRELLNTPEGRVALAERMSARPRWAEMFLDRFRAATPADGDNFGELLVELRREGALPPDTLVRGFFQDLIAKGRFEQAHAIWKTIVGVAGADAVQGVVDGGFDLFARQEQAWGPFGWRASESGMADAHGTARSEFSSDMALTVESDPGPPVEIVSQLLSLHPGHYTLSYDAIHGSGQRHAFRWVIRCLGENGASLLRETVVSQRSTNWNGERRTFQVPDGCPGQILALSAVGANEAASVSVDSVLIRSE